MAVGVVVVVTAVLRFVTTSPLWLDEALSANIAALPLGELPDALRQDGHPPLYYALLHVWMEVVGTGDTAVRSLSGVLGLAALPLAHVAGRRRAGRAGGLAVLALTAVTPWCVRYATEARMYALVFLLTLGGWLLAEDLLARPGRTRWVGLAGVTAALVLSHYWALHLGAAAVLLLGWRWWRGGAPERPGVVRVSTALGVGALAFVPWSGVFLDQLAHTGTPWATATRPTRAVVELAGGIGGGERYAEALLFGGAFVVLVVLGLTAVADEQGRVVLHPRTVPGARPELAVALLTVTVGLAVGFATDAVFVARYAAVFLPLLLIVAGLGLARLPAHAVRRAAAALVVVLSAVGLYANVADDRSQGAEVAGAIARQGDPGDVVAFCPDQLGPATLRSLPGSFRAVGLPALERPDRIDWRDYEARNRGADPTAAVDAVTETGGGGSVWLVVRTGYRTYEGYCEAVIDGLLTARPRGHTVVEDRGGEVFEPAALLRFPPAP